MNPPTGQQRIVPYLAYRDAPGAITFLCQAFGFEERFRYPMPDGRIGHAELTLQGSLLMLASTYEGFGASPLDLPAVNAQMYCYVDDPDAHHARARAAGATVVGEPTDQHGTRMYRALDPEGHRWIFARTVGER
jgi:uncharacterized glyoxalase superfamily protein PhnB